MKHVTIVGGGLAGSEAALQLASHGFSVCLIDSKPNKSEDVYKLSSFGELICNNILNGYDAQDGKDLLIQELRMLGSVLISVADQCRIPNKQYFSVNKCKFSEIIDSMLRNSHIEIISKEVFEIPQDENVIIATGALTNEELLENLSQQFNIQNYYFFDASCPIVDIQTVDLENENIVKTEDDSYTIKIPQKQLEKFCKLLGEYYNNKPADGDANNCTYNLGELLEYAASLGINEFIKRKLITENSKEPHILLRKENALQNNSFILERCATSLRHPEQRKVFSALPGMENCKFVKYGRVHRNAFIKSPEALDQFFRIKGTSTYVVGQLSGVDDYVAAIASGWVAAQKIIHGDRLTNIPPNTMIGGLAHYVSNPNITDFQPMLPVIEIMKCNSTDTSLESKCMESRNGIQALLQQIS